MTLNTIRSGGTAHPEVILLQLLSILLKSGGVKDLTDEDHFLVSENSGGADMQVEVQPGVAAVMKGLKAYPVYSDSAELATITSNVSGQGRIDAVVLYIDLGETPNADATNVAKLMVVAGTPAGSPAAPLDAAIQSAVGASNPFLRLANVAVANGASSITDANITDARLPFKVVVEFGSDEHGDVYFRDTNGEIQRLAPGTIGQALVTMGTGADPEWGNAAATESCRLSLSGHQSIANNSYTNISWNVENWDVGGLYDAGTPTRITFPTDGKYQINVQTRWSGISASGYRGLRGALNGSTTVIDVFEESDNKDAYQIVQATDILNVSAGDYLILSVFQNSGGNQDLYGGLTHATYVSVHRLS